MEFGNYWNLKIFLIEIFIDLSLNYCDSFANFHLFTAVWRFATAIKTIFATELHYSIFAEWELNDSLGLMNWC